MVRSVVVESGAKTERESEGRGRKRRGKERESMAEQEKHEASDEKRQPVSTVTDQT